MATVLVVGDSATSRELISALLEEEGHSTSHAGNGTLAIVRVGEAEPDLVITDLLMPELDGFGLVSQLKESHPHLPVMLVTSKGSEKIAARALREGAASYVSKLELKTTLIDAVDEVLDSITQEQHRKRLMGGLTRYEASFVLENDRELFQPLVAYLQEQLKHLKVCGENDLTRLGVALGEALVNAAEHGNLELDSQLREEDRAAYFDQAKKHRAETPYGERRVHLKVCLTRGEACFTIRDEGNGFDPSLLPDPTNPQNLLKASGRGVMLMRTFMDEVTFNHRGNEVTLIKRRG